MPAQDRFLKYPKENWNKSSETDIILQGVLPSSVTFCFIKTCQPVNLWHKILSTCTIVTRALTLGEQLHYHSE